MIINLEYDNNALLAPQSFRDGMQQAANELDAAYTDNITINIAVGYGEFLGGALPNQFTSEGNIDFNGVDGRGFGISYQSFRSLLISHVTSADDQTAVNNLPNVTDLPGHSGAYIYRSAQAKALGTLSANDARLDGAVGMGTQFTGNVLIGGALHELTHAMGRIAGTTLDLFRFNSNGSGGHVFGGDIPSSAAYFSIDGGATDLADFGINSDPGDWLNSGVQGPDAFNETIGGSVLSAVDLTEMDVLGFSRATSLPPAPPPPPGPPGPPRPMGGTSDFDGNGKSDVLWQNDNGQVYEWQMNGMSVLNAGFPGINTQSAWHVVATGDFNGDGKSDVLWQNDNGQVYEWLMNGMSVASAGVPGINTNPAWHVVGTGDFNGDGKSDVLWQNSNTGQVYEWQMNGMSVAAAGFVGGNTDPAWHVVGIGDFNGDHRADILWQNDDGQVFEWLMNGMSVASVGTPGTNTDPTWHVVGTGDFNGDGKSDVFWQNDNGQVYEWQMNGMSVAAAGLPGTNTDPAWHVVGTGDYNGDGKADILWQNSDSGQVYQWQMNGMSVASAGGVGINTNTAWHVTAAG